MNISGLDHLMLTVKNLNASIDFYTKIFGMNVITFGEERKALTFGNQKINLHESGKELKPTPGSADLCFKS